MGNLFGEATISLRFAFQTIYSSFHNFYSITIRSDMECHYPDAGSSAIFGRDADAEMGFEMGHHCAFINPQPTHDISHDQSLIGHSSTGEIA